MTNRTSKVASILADKSYHNLEAYERLFSTLDLPTLTSTSFEITEFTTRFLPFFFDFEMAFESTKGVSEMIHVEG